MVGCPRSDHSVLRGRPHNTSWTAARADREPCRTSRRRSNRRAWADNRPAGGALVAITQASVGIDSRAVPQCGHVISERRITLAAIAQIPADLADDDRAAEVRPGGREPHVVRDRRIVRRATEVRRAPACLTPAGSARPDRRPRRWCDATGCSVLRVAALGTFATRRSIARREQGVMDQDVAPRASAISSSDGAVSPEITMDRSAASNRGRTPARQADAAPAAVTLTCSSWNTRPAAVSSCTWTRGASGIRPSSAMRVDVGGVHLEEQARHLLERRRSQVSTRSLQPGGPREPHQAAVVGGDPECWWVRKTAQGSAVESGERELPRHRRRSRSHKPRRRSR